MTVETTRQVQDIARITRSSDAPAIALAAYDRLLTLLRSLEADDWRAPTACPGWDVADMVGHLIGAARAGASVRANLRQQLWGKRHAREFGGSTATGMPERLALSHLMDVVYTRDVWLHTIDITRATGRAYRPESAVDGRLIEDVVAEWVGRHRQPVLLTLTGPAGGRYRQGDDGGHLHLDAIDLCLILSGRAQPSDPGVEVVAEPADTARLLSNRVLF